jgi:anti-anti-sigma factor
MAEQFQLRTAATTHGHLVSVSGELDIATSPTLAEALVQFADGDVSADLSGVTFIDASGLSALIAAKRHIERRNGRLIVENMTPPVRRLFEITGLNTCIEIRSRAGYRNTDDDLPVTSRWHAAWSSPRLSRPAQDTRSQADGTQRKE